MQKILSKQINTIFALIEAFSGGVYDHACTFKHTLTEEITHIIDCTDPCKYTKKIAEYLYFYKRWFL